ncbi:hypothetical protein [Maritalea mediterranea]|uniref:Uncharacterized protein n=1 Tax=Maritalea mediterranea TaxID=2909667 RepID=A0ABS9ED48_9HYPH|nr:hypothetical protein [Maritalea mediterranea]MCF4099809.1 hypothetical protein [Maritalea mediterranea]
MSNLRTLKCKKCGSSFYAAEARDICQNCKGDYDRSKQEASDREARKSILKNPNTAEPQAVDPRTGQAAPKTPATKQTKSKSKSTSKE